MNVRLVCRALCVIAGALIATSCDRRTSPPQEAATTTPAAAPSPATTPADAASSASSLAYAGRLPPLPVSSFPAARPLPIVNAAYEFAARRPDVLRYVPCFCGCERNGHVHNEHCFVAGREADGTPRWDAHGMT